MKKLVQLLYTSKIVTLSSFQEQIKAILNKARESNKQNGVTGILMYRNGEFLQLLEGEQVNVYYTFKKIRDDERHKEVVVLFDSEAKKRVFGNWSMAFKEDGAGTPELKQSLTNLVDLKEVSSNRDIIRIINHFYFGD
jgi:hypothetical protein